MDIFQIDAKADKGILEGVECDAHAARCGAAHAGADGYGDCYEYKRGHVQGQDAVDDFLETGGLLCHAAESDDDFGPEDAATKDDGPKMAAPPLEPEDNPPTPPDKPNPPPPPIH